MSCRQINMVFEINEVLMKYKFCQNEMKWIVFPKSYSLWRGRSYCVLFEGQMSWIL